MRALIRTTPLFLAAAMVVLAPSISPGGGHKGDFDIDPREETADTDFSLAVDKGDGDGCIITPPLSSDGDVPDAVLLGVQLAAVRVQVVDTEGNAGPANTVLDSEFYTPDLSGDWGSPPTIPLNLPVGTYLVTAECREFNGTVPDAGAGDAESTSSSSQPEFVLLGDGEEPACTEVSGEQREDDGPGCYVPQELVIVAPAAEPREEEPTFTG